MPLCGPSCGCAIQSTTLDLSGSGSAGDPWQIEYSPETPQLIATRAVPESLTFAVPGGFTSFQLRGWVQHEGASTVHRVLYLRLNGDSTSGSYRASRQNFPDDVTPPVPSNNQAAGGLALGLVGYTASPFVVDILAPAAGSVPILGRGLSAASGGPTAGGWVNWVAGGKWVPSVLSPIVQIDVFATPDVVSEGVVSLYGMK